MGLPRRSIPSIAGLIAFEATARHLSFSRAAEDLSLSQGAVSKRVRQLEHVLGVPLLVRTTHQVCLTEIGRAYLTQVQKLLMQIEASTVTLKARARGRSSITLAVSSDFALGWLIPRLDEFNRRYPHILVNLVTRQEPRDFASDGIDCAIHDGPCCWSDTTTQHLFEMELAVVASPALARAQGWERPADLVDARHLRLAGNPHIWRDWFRLAGIPEAAVHGPSMDGAALIAEAAVAGQGVALLPRFLIAEELRAGKLGIVFNSPTLVERAYHFVLPARLASDLSVQAFAEWIAEEAAGCVRRSLLPKPAMRLRAVPPSRRTEPLSPAMGGAKL